MRTMELRAEPAKRKPGARTSYGMPSLDGGHPAKYPLCFPLFASASVRGGNSCPNASHARIASAHVLPGKRPGRIFRSDRAIPSDSMASDSVRSQPAHRVARQTHLQGVQTLTSTPIRECRPAAWAWRLRPRRADTSAAIRRGATPPISILAARGRRHPVYPDLRPRCAVRGRTRRAG